MRILALEPYYGGSHRAYIDDWIDGSRHRWTLLTLPPHHWKWRMRHGAVTLAAEVRRRVDAGEAWDGVWASDMLAVAEFRGLVPGAVAQLPTILYMHENQLTYPNPHGGERDLHFAFSNLVSAFSADAVWWNSDFHRRDLLTAAKAWLRRLPDFAPLAELKDVDAKSYVMPQGVHPPSAELPKSSRPAGPLRVVWSGRWEHDKNPEDAFAALEAWSASGGEFRLAVLGESFREVPSVFQQAKQRLERHLDHWGYAPSREAYEEHLRWGDVVISTARHEFFGVGVVEAMAAGCVPLLPDRLAYPEILAPMSSAARDVCRYDGTVDGLVDGLRRLDGLACAEAPSDVTLQTLRLAAWRATQPYHWTQLRPRLDDALEAALEPRGTSPG